MVKSKKSLLTMILFIVISIFSFSQTNGSNSEINQSNNKIENSFESDLNYFNTNENVNDEVNEYKTQSTTGFIVKTIVVLILIVAAIYGIMLFFKKKNINNKSEDDFLRKVSSLNLSPGKSIEIVSLIDHAYILGVTDSNINLIAEVEDKELIQAMNLNFDKKQNVKKPMNFSDVLDIFMPNGPRNKINVYEEAEKKVNNLNEASDLTDRNI